MFKQKDSPQLVTSDTSINNLKYSEIKYNNSMEFDKDTEN